MKIAVVDIGSNAARLKIIDVVINNNETEFNQLTFIRLPLRLGFDVFETGEISKKNIKKLIRAMKVFKSLITFYNVKEYKICATSAMRDAKNRTQIVEAVWKETGCKIEVITGYQEASLIHETHIAEHMNNKQGYLYIDVGGGSTEIIYFNHGKVRYKKSINIGTLRILKNSVNESNWKKMKSDLKAHIRSKLPLIAIGSGGNINKVFSLSQRKKGQPLSLKLLIEYYKELSPLSVEERMHRYGLREDRADVIVPALEIYIKLMTWAKIEYIYVPRIGLVDGLAHALYSKLV